MIASLAVAGCNVDAPLGSGTGDASPPDSIGVWVDVTPASVDLDPSSDGMGNFGVQDILVDPAKPSDLYAFICYQGVWRSTDYGLSWTKVSTGAQGAVLDTGRPWTAAIDPNPSRDPTTPPKLYTANGYGAVLGVYASTDGGVSWTHYDVPANNADINALAVDPYDGQHLLAGFHNAPGLVESTDGGATWTAVSVGAEVGNDLYPFFIDTGSASSTRATWLTEAQWNNGNDGTWKTIDGGASWTMVESFEHMQGNAQIFQAGGGVVFAAGAYGSQHDGVYRSTDYGSTWSIVSTNQESGVAGTTNYVYAWDSGASMSALAPMIERAPRSAGSPWSSIATPAAMTNGPKRTAVTSDGQHDILVSGNFLAGIWRYVE